MFGELSRDLAFSCMAVRSCESGTVFAAEDGTLGFCVCARESLGVARKTKVSARRRARHIVEWMVLF